VVPSSRCSALDLGAHLHAQLGVEVRERLVEQEHLRLAHDRAAHRDALALAAGELRAACARAAARAEDLAPPPHARSISSFGDLAQLQAERHVVATVMCG
jgi:hypothetical protein